MPQYLEYLGELFAYSLEVVGPSNFKNTAIHGPMRHLSTTCTVSETNQINSTCSVTMPQYLECLEILFAYSLEVVGPSNFRNTTIHEPMRLMGATCTVSEAN